MHRKGPKDNLRQNAALSSYIQMKLTKWNAGGALFFVALGGKKAIHLKVIIVIILLIFFLPPAIWTPHSKRSVSNVSSLISCYIFGLMTGALMFELRSSK